MNLTRLEMETIITFNAEEQTACCFTADKTMMRKIYKLIDGGNDIKILREGEDYLEVEVPKKWVKIRPPRKMSEEAKVAAGERMRSYWEEKNGGVEV